MSKKALIVYIICFTITNFGFSYFIFKEEFAEDWMRLLLQSLVIGIVSGVAAYLIAKKFPVRK